MSCIHTWLSHRPIEWVFLYFMSCYSALNPPGCDLATTNARYQRRTDFQGGAKGTTHHLAPGEDRCHQHLKVVGLRNADGA